MDIADALSRCHISEEDAKRARDAVNANGLRYVSVGQRHCDYECYI